MNGSYLVVRIIGVTFNFGFCSYAFCSRLIIMNFTMNSKTDESMVTDKSHNEAVNPNILLSNKMNISMVFKQATFKDPTRYTELRETINKAFEDMSNSISLEEFNNILGDISFLKSKKNSSNLLSTLKSQLYNHMSKCFEQLLKEENVSELFSKQNSLKEEEAKKYHIDNESMELYELEEYLRHLDIQIANLEQENEILFDQEKFNRQRYDKLTGRIINILKECKTKFENGQEITNMVQMELLKLFDNDK